MLGPGGVHRIAATVYVADDALGINYKSGAPGEAQKAEHAVLSGDFLFRITQQGKRQSQFLRKAAVGLRLVHADSENLSTRFFKRGKTILVCLEFLRSARGVGVNVTSQDHAVFPSKIAQPDPIARVVGQFKIRRRISDVQCHSGCP